jgi:hypothetical protein
LLYNDRNFSLEISGVIVDVGVGVGVGVGTGVGVGVGGSIFTITEEKFNSEGTLHAFSSKFNFD